MTTIFHPDRRHAANWTLEAQIAAVNMRNRMLARKLGLEKAPAERANTRPGREEKNASGEAHV